MPDRSLLIAFYWGGPVPRTTVFNMLALKQMECVGGGGGGEVVCIM